MVKGEKILKGVAGEYLVAGELSKRGYVASITLKNTRGFDILVANSEATKQVAIQVKTDSKNSEYWILSEQADNYYSDNFFYVLVKLKGLNERPDFYIVPSKVVADQVRKEHAAYYKAKGKNPADYTMRKFFGKEQKYLEKWDLLGLD